MATNKLVNFRCPDTLIAAIEVYGRSRGYDQSKAIRECLVAGLETLTNGEVRLERNEVQNQNSNNPNLEEVVGEIVAQISSQFEDRFRNLEEALAGK